jgi:hypothetical protein
MPVRMKIETFNKRYQDKSIRKIYSLCKVEAQRLSKELRQVSPGYCQCFVTNQIKPIKQMQGGHFKHTGSSMPDTGLWHINIHPQTVKSNYYDNNEGMYRAKMIEKYGESTVNLIEWKSKQSKKWEKSELIQILWDLRHNIPYGPEEELEF